MYNYVVQINIVNALLIFFSQYVLEWVIMRLTIWHLSEMMKGKNLIWVGK